MRCIVLLAVLVACVSPLAPALAISREHNRTVQRLPDERRPVVLATALRRALGGSPTRHAGERLQLAVRALVVHPELRRPTLLRLGKLAGTGRLLVGAGASLRAMSPPGAGLPRWRIVEPKSARALLRAFVRAQHQTGVPWRLLAAIMLVETRMGRVRGPSSAGALGPMQFLPSTWAIVGRGSIFSERDSILAAGRYLRNAGAPGRIDRAIYAYNHDARYVAAVHAYYRAMTEHHGLYGLLWGWRVIYSLPHGSVLLTPGYDHTR